MWLGGNNTRACLIARRLSRTRCRAWNSVGPEASSGEAVAHNLEHESRQQALGGVWKRLTKAQATQGWALPCCHHLGQCMLVRRRQTYFAKLTMRCAFKRWFGIYAITTQGCPFSTFELRRQQGVPFGSWKLDGRMSDLQVRAMLGNSCTIIDVGRLLVKLVAAHTPQNKLVDAWGSFFCVWSVFQPRNQCTLRLSHAKCMPSVTIEVVGDTIGV